MARRIMVQVRSKDTTRLTPDNKLNKQVGPSLEETRFYRETDIREKRIGIVFKVIYVVAAFFAALFTSLSVIREFGLSDVYILESVCAGFLLCLLVYLLTYIFNEMKCLKLRQEAISLWQYKRTEESYAFVFTYFTIGSIISVLLAVAIGVYKEFLTKSIVILVISLGALIACVIGNITAKRLYKTCCVISSVLWTVVSAGFFISIVLP